MIFFFLRKLITGLLMPLPFSVLLVLAGVLLSLELRGLHGGRAIYRTRGSRWNRYLSRGLVAAGCLVLAVSSCTPAAARIIRPLEQRYPPVTDGSALPENPLIVVLGAGGYEDASVSPVSRVSAVGLARLAEGIRLYRLAAGGRFMFAAGSVYGGAVLSEVMRDAAVDLGVDPGNIVIRPEGRTTAGEAEAVSLFLQASGRTPDPVVLVTSASHLPRAVREFTRRGIPVLPAPADYEGLPRGHFSPSDILPSASALRITERALHEYLGLIASRLFGPGLER